MNHCKIKDYYLTLGPCGECAEKDTCEQFKVFLMAADIYTAMKASAEPK